MDINKNSADSIKLNDLNLSINTKNNVSETNRYTTDKKLPKKKLVNHGEITEAVVCTTSNQQQKHIIRFYEKKYDPKAVAILDANNDLNDSDLLQTIHCDENGKLIISAGRLFSNEQLQLIINISDMSAGEIARLNDLLSSPPTYLGKPLGKNVNRIVIMDHSMLHNTHNGPAADCWRRLAKLNFYGSPKEMGIASLQATSADNNNASNSLQDGIPELDQLTDEQNITLNFSTENNWKALLFGDIAINETGKIYFHHGCLENIQQNKKIVLQDAPWDNQEFVSTLATALRQGGFRTNGNWISLPKNLEIVQQNTDQQQLTTLKDKLVVNADKLENLPTENINTVCVNAHNLEDILANVQLQDGVMCSCDTLAELIADSKYILVTSPLSEKQWLQLLTRINKLTISKPIIVDCTTNIENKQLVSQNAAITCKLYTHQATAIANYQQQGHAIYQITADTNPIELWQDIALTSQNDFVFNQQNTKLLTELQQGKPIVFYGVESNLQVMSQLESLLVQPPCLFINGKKILLPDAQITLLLPDFKRTDKNSALWNSYLQQATTIQQKSKSYFDYSFVNKMLEMITDFASPLKNKYIPFKQQNFNEIFAKQLRIECELDNSSVPLPVHYRKASHNLIAKYYRDQPEIYGYLKTQINILMPDNHEPMVDASVLKKWLEQHPDANKTLLAKNFWSLVRHCSPKRFNEGFYNKLKYLEFNIKEDNDAIEKLAEILLGLVEDSKKEKFKQSFGLDKQDKLRASPSKMLADTKNPEFKKILETKLASLKPNEDTYIYYNGKLKSQLYDALFIVINELQLQQPLTTIVNRLAPQIEHAIQQYSQDQAIIEVFSLLSETFPEALLTDKFNNLAELLVTGKTSSKNKHQRRLKRFIAKLQQHPLIFLQGTAGTGKSHMAKEVSKELTNQTNTAEPIILSLSPETTSQDLYGTQRLIQKTNSDDSYTKFVNGPILDWAVSDNPPVLILDEANLVNDGILAPLAGLMHNPKQLVYAGKIYPLSEKHRVILTGNPDSYDGRGMDLAIKNAMLTMHYHPMTQDSITQLIIEPSLPTTWSSTEKQQAIVEMLHLYTAYNTEFSINLGPRDLQDVLARMQISLAYNDTSKQAITSSQINHLVWQCFKEAIAGSIDSKQQHKLTQLETNYTTSFPQDTSILVAREQQFVDFLIKLKQQNPHLQLTSTPVTALVRNYWLFLNNQNSKLIARHGMWVEGPAGWGKDVIVDAVLTLWEQENPPTLNNNFVHINANPNQWDKLVDTILTAMQNGQKLVISEINLLPSSYLEGLFNDILTKPSASGFVLFATVNPASFANREVLSVAFMSRVTQVKLNNLTREQFENILSAKFPNAKLVSWLLDNYQILADQLKQQNSPIVLTLDDLLTLAFDMQNIPQDKWLLLFKKNFGLAMKSINFTLADLLTATASVGATTVQPVDRDVSCITNTVNTALFEADNITNKASYKPIRYFANYPNTTKYRLNLFRVTVDKGNIAIQRLFTDDASVEPIMPTLLAQQQPLKLQQGEVLGSSKFQLKNDQWVMLPGISYNDECCGIRSDKPILLARSKITGQLMVKLKENTEPQVVKVDFIIKPNLVNLDTANVAKKLEPATQDKYLRQLLDAHIFSQEALKYESCRELQQIKAIAAPKLKMQQLISWAQNFKYDRNATSTGNNAFIEVIQQQIGTCVHRSISFQVLAEYFGIPTNIIENDSHAFVEFSLDNRISWISVNLGGAPAEVNEINPEFPDYTNTTKLDSFVVNGEYLDELDRLLASGAKFSPLQLINFLIHKFPFYENTEYFGHIRMQLITYLAEGNIKILANVQKIFLSWIQRAREQQSDILQETARDNITMCISYLYQIYQMAPLQDSRSKLYKDTLIMLLPMIKELGIVSPLLPMLEDFTADTSCSTEVLEILNEFYQKFTNKQQQIEDMQNNKALYDLTVVKHTELFGTSKSLLSALQRVSLKKYWSYTSTGKTPDLTRLATKKPAFPIKQDTKNARVATFISASSGNTLNNNLMNVFNDFISNPANFTKIKQVVINYDIDHKQLQTVAPTVVYSFIIWILQSCTNDCTILFDDNTVIGDSIHYKLQSGYLQVDPNIFSYEEYASIWLNCSEMIITPHGTAKSELNLETLCDNFNKPTGLLLTKDFLTICFQEYLETIDWSKL